MVLRFGHHSLNILISIHRLLLSVCIINNAFGWECGNVGAVYMCFRL